MQRTIKYYPRRYNGKSIRVVIKWTPEFLESVKNRFGFYKDFTSKDVISLFKCVSEGDAARHKLSRLYRQGWFVRRLEPGYLTRSYYIYNFSEGAKQYNRYYGSFKTGPLVAARIPEVFEKPIEIKKEFILQDLFIGEL